MKKKRIIIILIMFALLIICGFYFYFENTSSLPEGQLAEIIELLENRPPEELKWIRDLIKLTDKRPAA